MAAFQGPLDTRPASLSSVQIGAYSADHEVKQLSHQTGEGTARGMRIDQIQQQVGKGEYQVDNHAVADAILRRILGVGGRTVAPPTADD
jgi:anti-sigma28 factor (negative regulator of flagellin synthesis)